MDTAVETQGTVGGFNVATFRIFDGGGNSMIFLILGGETLAQVRISTFPVEVWAKRYRGYSGTLYADDSNLNFSRSP